jgi:hypothetical protein
MCLSNVGSARTVGVGITGLGEIGIGGAVTKSGNALASKYTPGSEPSLGSGCLAGLGFLLLFGVWLVTTSWSDNAEGASTALVVGALLVIGGIAIFLYMRSHVAIEHEKWVDRVKMYKHGWICHQCGATWIPQQDRVGPLLR